MLTEYINVAMRRAHYTILPDNEGYYGRIEGIQGVWANAESLEVCREELREVLEEWIILGLKIGHPIPIIDNVDLNISLAEAVKQAVIDDVTQHIGNHKVYDDLTLVVLKQKYQNKS